MAADIDTAFRRLVELGRDKGFVTLDEVKTVLPIDRMSQRDLALTLDRLEQSGVSVELDEELTARPRDGGTDTSEMPDFRLPDPPDDDTDRVVPLRPRQTSGPGQPMPQRTPSTEAAAHTERPRGSTALPTSSARTAVVIAIAALLVILVFVLLR